jgi:hypothetical protein
LIVAISKNTWACRAGTRERERERERELERKKELERELPDFKSIQKR